MRTADQDRFLTGVPGYCKQDQPGPGNSKQVPSMHILCSIVGRRLGEDRAIRRLQPGQEEMR